MGIASFSHSPTLSVIFAPVQALASWFVPQHGGSSPHAAQSHPAPGGPAQLALPFANGPHAHPAALGVPTAIASNARADIANGRKATQPRPCAGRVRVLRELDETAPPASTGRLIISGRMADVCAELDRLAQLENATR